MGNPTEDISRLTHLATCCNASRTFIERHWVESPETVRELMSSPAFEDALKGLHGLSLSDSHVVSALFRARKSVVSKKKGIPPGLSKWQKSQKRNRDSTGAK